MIVIIVGGRSYDFTPLDIHLLDLLHDEHNFTKVLSGDCSRIITIADPITNQKRNKRVGADYCGEQWAKKNNIPCAKYKADWFKLGKAAGPIRNQRMIDEADALVAFPGSSGTADVIHRAKDAGLLVWISFGDKYLDVTTNKVLHI